jgi:hypothetical protein
MRGVKMRSQCSIIAASLTRGYLGASGDVVAAIWQLTIVNKNAATLTTSKQVAIFRRIEI